MDSLVLSEYILERKGPMSHLKLQKLLYYVEAFHLAIHGASIVRDNFEAWVHGPVSRCIFNSLKAKSLLHKEIEYIPTGRFSPKDRITRSTTGDQRNTVNEVIDVFGKLTSMRLEALTHSEKPWMDARKGYNEADKYTVAISKETMKKFYRAKIYG